nr:transglutaminaseTgpA domain-containing protein [Listeria fleischmannii]
MRSKVITLILYVLSVLLISEWIYPFIFLTDLKNPLFMVIYLALSLAVFFLGWRFYVTIPIHLVSIYLLMGIYFHQGRPLDPKFLSDFIQIIEKGFRDLLSFNAYDISIAFITLIFFVAIWLLNYITSFTILKKQRIMSVLALTVAYIAVVNTFTEYAGQMALVRTVIIGFLLLHFALSKRLETPNRLSGLTEKKRPILYHLSMILLIIIFLSSALLFPQQKPVFDDPVPYIRETLGMNTTRTVGYSEDDSELGGALKPDHSQVFQVWSEKEHYYRVETKRTYTGRGWLRQIERVLRNLRAANHSHSR